MSLHSANLVTRVLAATAAVLLLFALAQFAGLGSGYRWAPAGAVQPDGDDNRATQLQLSRNAFELPALMVFNDIADRPLFNDDRQPAPLDGLAEEDEDDEPEVPLVPLNVVLTGTIVTPDLAVAMVRDARGQSTSLRVGMPLEDDQAGWTLIEVKPHGAIFRNSANESAELELQTAGTAENPVTRTAQPRRQAVNPRQAQRPGDAARPDPDELAKRIEERRRQMREEAERIRKGAAEDDDDDGAEQIQPHAASGGRAPQKR